MAEQKKSPGPSLIRGLTDLRDVLRRGEEPGAHFKITYRCRLCSRTDKHTHCPECGSTEHAADQCDMEG